MKHALQDVGSTADRLVTALEPACEMIAVAGSIRRAAPEVKDIEIVAIPIRPRDLFGDITAGPTKLDRELAKLREAIERGDKWGDKYKRLTVKLPSRLVIAVDLFITTPEAWPVIFAIRTGPAEYSQKMVTQQHKNGLLKNGHAVRDGRVWNDGGEPVAIESEREFFEGFVLGGYIEPDERKNYATHVARARDEARVEKLRQQNYEHRGARGMP